MVNGEWWIPSFLTAQASAELVDTPDGVVSGDYNLKPQHNAAATSCFSQIQKEKTKQSKAHMIPCSTTTTPTQLMGL